MLCGNHNLLLIGVGSSDDILTVSWNRISSCNKVLRDDDQITFATIGRPTEDHILLGIMRGESAKVCCLTFGRKAGAGNGSIPKLFLFSAVLFTVAFLVMVFFEASACGFVV